MSNIYEKLSEIQLKLKAPKSQYNKFGNYNYRSCEDILEGLKPILSELKTTLLVTDEIKLIGNRYYLEATVKLIDIETGETIESKALAREDEHKKGMDLAQVTGSVSSYARKYALNGLFAIDDTKDSDYPIKEEKADKYEKVIENRWNNKKAISQKQVEEIYIIASKKGISKETVDKQVFKQLNKKITVLSKEEYDIVCSGYEKLAVAGN